MSISRNGDFSKGLDDWVGNVSTLLSLSPSFFGNSAPGVKVERINTTSPWSGVWQWPLDVIGGERYTVNALTKADAGVRYYFQINCQNAQSEYLESFEVQMIGNGQPQWLHGEFTIPEGAILADIGIYVGVDASNPAPGGIIFYVDDFWVSPINTQPILPAESTPSDSELLFLAEEPKGVFPENQNSNWGLLRRVLTMEPQEAIDTLSELALQMYVATATGGVSGYLNRWEEQMGLPINPAGYTDAQRRAWIQVLRRVALFSVARIEQVVESFLPLVGSGVPTSFGVEGIPTSAGGFTLFGEGGSATSQYNLYFNPRTFSYEVWIVNSTTPDIVGLNRMLGLITPAGQSFTIDNSKSAIVDYGRTVLGKQPVAFYRLADFTDSSGYANNGTSFGTITALASPGLLTAGKNDDQAAKTFDGSTGYFTAPDANQLDVGDIFTIEFWFKPATIAAGQRMIVDKGANGFAVYQDANALLLAKSTVGSVSISSLPLVAGTTYHVVIRRLGNTVKWTINNVDVPPAYSANNVIENTSAALSVGRTNGAATWFLNGSLDELAIYNRMLTDEEITENYNAGKNLNP